jgi:Lrp/AsnC family leucine-responsive transcriptional regulator
VIDGFGARVNVLALGVGLKAIIRIKSTHATLQKYLRLFHEMPEVVEVHRVTGEDCFIVRCAIADAEDLERVVDALAAHGPVVTSVVLSHPVRKIVSASRLRTSRATPA